MTLYEDIERLIEEENYNIHFPSVMMDLRKVLARHKDDECYTESLMHRIVGDRLLELRHVVKRSQDTPSLVTYLVLVDGEVVLSDTDIHVALQAFQDFK